MAYLRGYSHDAFVSYAHGPRTALSRNESTDPLGRWSRRLIEDVSELVAVKLRTKDKDRQLDLWMDPILKGNEPLKKTLRERVESSALLVAILSPFFLESEFCLKEVGWFSQTEAASGANRRIFVVRGWYTEHASWPAALKDADGVGYSFLPRDEEDADPYDYPCSSEKSEAYLSVVRRLANDIASEIKSIERNNPAGPTIDSARPAPEPKGGSVFLGFMSETLEDERAELRERLSAAGLTVFPPKDDEPVDESSLRSALAAHLQDSRALVLVANEYPGMWPKGQDGGFVGYQIQAAKERNVPCYLWLRADDLGRIKKKEYREYLERLSQQAHEAKLGLRYGGVDDFAASVRASLVTTDRDPGGGVEQLAVICSNLSGDRDVGEIFRDAVREAVQDTKREIFIFDFADGRERVKLGKLGERIRDADTVLVVCFDQEWDWARGLIREISGLSELRGGQRAKLLVACPRDRDEGLYDASVFGFKTLNGLNVGAAQIKNMLKQEFEKLAAANAAKAVPRTNGSATR